MAEVNCKVNVNKPAKPQALAFINELKAILPIERTRMHLRVTCGNGAEQAEFLLKQLSDKFASQFQISSQKPLESAIVLELRADPALFREINTIVKQEKDELFKDVTVEIVDAQDTFE